MIATRHFTPAEARKTLPLVKKIVKDILQASAGIRLIAEDLNGKIEDNQTVKKLISDVNNCMQELEEIGCYYKDWNFSLGLVDFPAIIDGQEVFLCWKSDEEEILYYHEIEAGFAGRKIIPDEYFTDEE